MATIVNISGTGNTYSCYATVNGTKYTSSKSNLELTSSEIVFGTYNDVSNSSYGKITIDGVVVKSSNGDGYNTTYRWTVPSDVTEVNIVLSKSTYSVTVTTQKSESSGSDSDSSGGEHYTNIGSTAREIESGTVLIGGVLREIESGMTLVGGVAREIVFSSMPAFADATWEQVIMACQNNEVPDTWAVGDSKPMTINGTSYQIDIIGKNHDDYSDGSGKAPLTFQMHSCYSTKYPMNSTVTNKGGWTDCAMRKTHLPSILSQMPSEIQANTREVKKLTSAGGTSSTINTTADKLFLLSNIEITGSDGSAKSGEGSQYAYYAEGNSKIKNLGTSTTANAWWTRSPVGMHSLGFCAVSSSGSAGQSQANNNQGVAFGFCF